MKNDFEEIWGRIKKETGLKSLQNLGDVIRRTQPTISAAKTKQKFPPEWAYLVGKKFGFLTEWIMTGEGPKRLGELPKNRNFKILDQAEEWLAEEVKKNPKKEIWFEVEFERTFSEFKKWKEEKEEKEGNKSGFLSSKVA